MVGYVLPPFNSTMHPIYVVMYRKKVIIKGKILWLPRTACVAYRCSLWTKQTDTWPWSHTCWSHMVVTGHEVCKWVKYHIFRLSYKLKSHDLWPSFATFDLINKWGFPCFIYEPSLVEMHQSIRKLEPNVNLFLQQTTGDKVIRKCVSCWQIALWDTYLISLESLLVRVSTVEWVGIPARCIKHGPKSYLVKEKCSPGATPWPARVIW